MRAMLDQLMGSDNGMCFVWIESLFRSIIFPLWQEIFLVVELERRLLKNIHTYIHTHTHTHLDVNYIVVPCFSSFKAQRDNFSLIMNICTMFDLFDELVSVIDLLYSNEFFIVFWVIKSFSQSLTYSHDVLIYVGLKEGSRECSITAKNEPCEYKKFEKVASPCE